MIKIELHLGIMTNKELAEWFEIKEKSFRDTRKKKLKILEEYAEFENMWGKVNITKIISPIYKKGSKDYKFIKEKTFEQWDKSGLDTCKFVSEKINRKYSKEITISKDSLYVYTCNSRKDLWGKVGEDGEIGTCKYEICKKLGCKCYELTEEEKKIKNELLTKYYGNEVSEKIIFIKDMLENQEISEEECWQELEKMTDIENRFMNFKNELQQRIGAKIIRATRVETNAFKCGNIKSGTFEF